MKRGQTGRFFAPDRLKNHTSEGKGNEKKKNARKKKGGQEKKALVALLAFMLTKLELVCCRGKNCLTEEVYLAVTFSKMRLDLFFRLPVISRKFMFPHVSILFSRHSRAVCSLA